jgi:hypothetical protein
MANEGQTARTMPSRTSIGWRGGKRSPIDVAAGVLGFLA